MAKKIALGKGIASLIKDVPPEVIASKQLQKMNDEGDLNRNFQGTLMVSVNDIHANPNQPRKIFKESELLELKSSIEENGIIQPLVVHEENGRYHLIAGERRLRAAKLASISHVPVVVKQVTDKQKMVVSIIENVQRSNLNCVEEALAYYHLLEEFKLTQEEVAKNVGKDRSSVANFLRILKLPRKVIEMLQREELSFGHAKVLASEKDKEKILRLAQQVLVENLSVRELEKLAKSKKIGREVKEDSVEQKRLKAQASTLRDKLENKTGFHFDVKFKKMGSGQISIKFSNEAEFNDVFEYLLSKKK